MAAETESVSRPGERQRPAAGSADQLRRPRRAVVAAIEVTVVVAAVVVAVLCWRHGIVTTTITVDGTGHELRRYSGRWVAVAVALVAFAGVLLADAVRQAALAARIRSGPA